MRKTLPISIFGLGTDEENEGLGLWAEENFGAIYQAIRISTNSIEELSKVIKILTNGSSVIVVQQSSDEVLARIVRLVKEAAWAYPSRFFVLLLVGTFALNSSLVSETGEKNLLVLKSSILDRELFYQVLPILLPRDLERVQSLSKEERAEVREEVVSQASLYVDPALAELKSREKSFRQTASTWQISGFVSLTFAVLYLLASSFFTELPSDYLKLAVNGIRFISISALFVGLAKYAFDMGKAFMGESLRNADRAHAINFGKFYLAAYADQANWSEIKDVFSEWNIDKPSAFATIKSSDFDPKLTESLLSLAKSLAEKKES